jgi:two-component system cell cycle response regulator CpdR
LLVAELSAASAVGFEQKADKTAEIGRFSLDFYSLQQMVNRAKRARMSAQAEPNTKILLAEDDNDMRRFLVKALQAAGYDVASFDNGLSAYNRLREEPFELLLTDIVMPEMDGIELARRATELDPEIKVMFITGFAAVALNPDNNAPKDARILSKPFHLKDLVAEVQRLLAA